MSCESHPSFCLVTVQLQLTEAPPSSGDHGYCSPPITHVLTLWYLHECMLLIRTSLLQFVRAEPRHKKGCKYCCQQSFVLAHGCDLGCEWLKFGVGRTEHVWGRTKCYDAAVGVAAWVISLQALPLSQLFICWGSHRIQGTQNNLNWEYQIVEATTGRAVYFEMPLDQHKMMSYSYFQCHCPVCSSVIQQVSLRIFSLIHCEPALQENYPLRSFEMWGNPPSCHVFNPLC